MEKCGNSGNAHTLRFAACSACGGDYEDPDRTATEPEPEDLEQVKEAEDETA